MTPVCMYNSGKGDIWVTCEYVMTISLTVPYVVCSLTDLGFKSQPNTCVHLRDVPVNEV